MIRKAEFNEQRLLLLVTALKRLFADENFVTLLRAERLDTLPKYLAEEMKARTAA
jgi:ParB family chromosome partitioning protein